MLFNANIILWVDGLVGKMQEFIEVVKAQIGH